MGKALIVYSTRTGETKNIAELIAEGIRISGAKATLMNVTGIKNEKDLDGYDAYIFGAATYHGEMIQGMKKMLFLSEKANLEGKVGGSFGAFGWSGEAPGRIFETMEHVFKMDMVSGPLLLKSSMLGGATVMAQDYGREISKKMSDS